MIRIRSYARERMAELTREPLFRTLAQTEDVSKSLQMLPHLAFWANVFQDLLLLNLQPITDPELKRIIEEHYREDAGHNLWLADDLRFVYGRLPDLVEVFDTRYLRAREISYALMFEVYRAESDWERLLLPIVLEESGKHFLPAMIGHFERAGVGRHLRALGTMHVQSEAAHELHGDALSERMLAMDLPEDCRARAMAMVDRSYGAFARLSAILNEAILHSSPDEERRIQDRLSAVLAPAAQ